MCYNAYTRETALRYKMNVEGVFLVQGSLTCMPGAVGSEGGSSCAEGVSCGRVHYAGVEGRIRVGPEGRERHNILQDTRRRKRMRRRIDVW